MALSRRWRLGAKDSAAAAGTPLTVIRRGHFAHAGWGGCQRRGGARTQAGGHPHPGAGSGPADAGRGRGSWRPRPKASWCGLSGSTRAPGRIPGEAMSTLDGLSRRRQRLVALTFIAIWHGLLPAVAHQWLGIAPRPGGLALDLLAHLALGGVLFALARRLTLFLPAVALLVALLHLANAAKVAILGAPIMPDDVAALASLLRILEGWQQVAALAGLVLTAGSGRRRCAPPGWGHKPPWASSGRWRWRCGWPREPCWQP
ncbi:MAG: hypothetical protein MZV65_00095 [Chromatiales bacterium]|nr:hypothetical protein [Chromatiales bacterium]